MSISRATALCSLSMLAVYAGGAPRAHAHPQPPSTMMRPAPLPMARLLDAQQQLLLVVSATPGAVFVSTRDLQTSPAWVCFERMQCARVVTVIACEQDGTAQGESEELALYRRRWSPSPRCGPGFSRVVHEVPRPMEVPPTVSTPTIDPCPAGEANWVNAASASVGVELAWFDGVPRLGATFAPGFRRLIAPRTPSDVSSTSTQCATDAPVAVFGGVFFGSELGFDVRGHLSWGLGTAREELTVALGVAPIARIVVGGGRVSVPSVLGALLPEVGYTMHPRQYDDAGVRLPRTRTEWGLLLRPANWNVRVHLTRAPFLSVDFSAAPWFGVPFSGQAPSFGATASVSVNVLGW